MPTFILMDTTWSELVPELGGVSVRSQECGQRGRRKLRGGRQGKSKVGTRMWGETDGDREIGRGGGWAESLKHCTCGPGVGGPGGGPRGLQRRRDGEAGEAQGGAWRGQEGEILRPLETAS